MKTFAAICVALILTVISGTVESVRKYSRSILYTGTPAFQEKPGHYFHGIPTSTYDPLIKSYVKEHIDECLPVELYCLPHDPSYCIFFDYCGNIAGIQIGYIQKYAEEVDPKDYSFHDNPNFIKTKVCNETIWAVRIWFTNPEEMTEDCRQDVSEVIEGLFIYIDGKLLRFDQRCQPVGPSIGDFDLQGCVPKKGTLYIYKFNKHSTCHDGFYLFLVYDRNSLVGFGHAAPGNFPPGPTRDWFDHPSGERLAQIVPSPPSCWSNILRYGLTSSVTFLIDDPYNIKCPVCGC